MKILVLLLSLLFSVSGFGMNSFNLSDNFDPYSELRQARDTKTICTLYSKSAIYKEQRCEIPLKHLALSRSRAQNNRYTCRNMLKGDQENGNCYLTRENLKNLRIQCLYQGVNCPTELKNSKPDNSCRRELSPDLFCSLDNHEDEITQLTNALNKLIDKSKNHCQSIETVSLIGYGTIDQYHTKCAEAQSACQLYCSEQLCGEYELPMNELGTKSLEFFNTSTYSQTECTDKTKVEPLANQNEHLRALLVEEGADAIFINSVVNKNFTRRRVASTGQDSPRKFSPLSQTAITGDENKTTPYIAHGKFKNNTAHVKETFNKLDQKMADRLNQGKATKEDRKPNNTIASVSNDNSLPNKKKNNKYLVASSNDSFLTKKDIFKTVSNAYYKMCQTDSCYGIVKK